MYQEYNKKRPAPLLRQRDINYMPPEIDEYDENHQLKFNLQPVWHKDIQPCCGLYLMKFSNGMYYVGQTNNIYKRLTQHYLAFLSGEGDWHYEIHKLLEKAAEKSGKTIQYEFYRHVKFEIQYTSTVENAKLLEKMALSSILERNMQKKYYNTEYFVKNDEKYKKTVVKQRKYLKNLSMEELL